MWIVAADGLVFDTLALRTDALCAAMSRESLTVVRWDVRNELPGRRLRDVIYRVAPDADETTGDLVALMAQRAISERMSDGIALQPQFLAFRKRCDAKGERIVLRADSIRRDVERLVRFSELNHLFSAIWCADDAMVPAHSMISAAYEQLSARLRRTRAITLCSLEVSQEARLAAIPYVDEAFAVDALP